MKRGRGILTTGAAINAGRKDKQGVRTTHRLSYAKVGFTLDKAALQRFAVWAHNKLSDNAVKIAHKLGIISDEIYGSTAASENNVRELAEYINLNGFEKTVEDAACFGFIRIITVSYMEANGYLTGDTLRIIQTVLPSSSLIDESCLELLIAGDSEIRKRIRTDIPEQAWHEGVQTVGWLYQYFISEKHDSLVDTVGKAPVSKADIPVATQLFTPDWVVRYMVDNSLGRYWIERNPGSRLVKKLQFFVTPKDGIIEYTEEPVRPQDITIIDPCMGSAHILVYAFEVLMEIYRECGYTDKEAVEMIVSRNLYGLDIDDRCSKLAYFSVMMKALSYDPGFLRRGLKPHLLSIQESDAMPDICFEDKACKKTFEYLKTMFSGAKEKGTLLELEPMDYDGFMSRIDETDTEEAVVLMLKRLAEQAKLLSKKYTVVCTNPPYMNKLGPKLKKFVLANFKAYSGDLFSVFVYRCLQLCVPGGGYCAYMTPFVWMFIKTYERLRSYIINEHFIVTLIQMEYSAFEEAVVPLCAFVLKNGKKNANGLYIRLSDFKGGMDIQRKKVLEALDCKDCGWFFEAKQDNFTKFPGSPIAYWMSERFSGAFENAKKLDELSDYTGSQNKTADNKRFLRFFWEVEDNQIGPGKRWIFYSKGGEYRKHYGNLVMVADWSDESREYYRLNINSNMLDEKYWYREGISYTMLTSKGPSFRYMPPVGAFDMGGPEICGLEDELYYVMGFLGSKVAEAYLGILNPTMNLQTKDVKSLPIIISNEFHDEADKAERKCVRLSKKDWDSFEISSDFKRHPLLRGKALISEAFKEWELECELRFKKLKRAEEKLNRIFIRIYGLENELSPEVGENGVTVRKADISRDIRSLLSYAVGGMFGRYSLELDGTADGKKYSVFQPVSDNVVLFTESGFGNDIIGLLEMWLKAAFGEDSLEENLSFIESALGGVGNPREAIRDYFLKKFYSDHCRIYRKRPVYWLFDSGRNNGFKALVYMHRFEGSPPFHALIGYAESLREQYSEQLANANYAFLRRQENVSKCFQKLRKQETEISEYIQKLRILSGKNIKIDLNDGVAYNYTLLSDVLSKIK